MLLPTRSDIRTQMERWLGQAVAAVDPLHATRRALDATPRPTVSPAIIALGKAAAGMATAAVEWLASHGLDPAGGIVVADRLVASPHRSLQTRSGDHPSPGQGSLAASNALADCVAGLETNTPVHVFLSGGTSSLVAAPLDGITPAELREAFDLFHQLGLDIVAMNGLRRRLTRWSGGRLAAALGDRPVQAWVISDVIGNDLTTIGSGPLAAGPTHPDSIRSLLANPQLVARVPESVRTALSRHAPFTGREIPHCIVADGRMAAAAIAAAAHADGVQGTAHRLALTGDATEAGTELGRWVREEIRSNRLPDRASGNLVAPVPRTGIAHVWLSETTVALPESAGLGGRAQQMALAAAREIGALRPADVATVMIAATDGRDGPTDAAGAIIDAGTHTALQDYGVDVDSALARCDAYPALDQVGALLRTGRTGTNVADLVVVWMWNWY